MFFATWQWHIFQFQIISYSIPTPCMHLELCCSHVIWCQLTYVPFFFECPFDTFSPFSKGKLVCLAWSLYIPRHPSLTGQTSSHSSSTVWVEGHLTECCTKASALKYSPNILRQATKPCTWGSSWGHVSFAWIKVEEETHLTTGGSAISEFLNPFFVSKTDAFCSQLEVVLKFLKRSRGTTDVANRHVQTSSSKSYS